MSATGRHVSKLSGYAPALPTPLNARGDIDAAAFVRLCKLQIAHGATALVVCGTTGEAPTLSPAEHRDLIRMAVSVSRGRIPVIAGAGANATAHAIELTKDAEAAGADAILSVVPYYNKPTQVGLYAHFRAIAELNRIAGHSLRCTVTNCLRPCRRDGRSAGRIAGRDGPQRRERRCDAASAAAPSCRNGFPAALRGRRDRLGLFCAWR